MFGKEPDVMRTIAQRWQTKRDGGQAEEQIGSKSTGFHLALQITCFNEVTLTVCGDPAHYLFWDHIHPTVFMHSFLAVAIETLYAH
jgi:hypothetical protein